MKQINQVIALCLAFSLASLSLPVPAALANGLKVKSNPASFLPKASNYVEGLNFVSPAFGTVLEQFRLRTREKEGAAAAKEIAIVRQIIEAALDEVPEESRLAASVQHHAAISRMMLAGSIDDPTLNHTPASLIAAANLQAANLPANADASSGKMKLAIAGVVLAVVTLAVSIYALRAELGLAKSLPPSSVEQAISATSPPSGGVLFLIPDIPIPSEWRALSKMFGDWHETLTAFQKEALRQAGVSGQTIGIMHPEHASTIIKVLERTGIMTKARTAPLRRIVALKHVMHAKELVSTEMALREAKTGFLLRLSAADRELILSKYSQIADWPKEGPSLGAVLVRNPEILSAKRLDDIFRKEMEYAAREPSLSLSAEALEWLGEIVRLRQKLWNIGGFLEDFGKLGAVGTFLPLTIVALQKMSENFSEEDLDALDEAIELVDVTSDPERLIETYGETFEFYPSDS